MSSHNNGLTANSVNARSMTPSGTLHYGVTLALTTLTPLPYGANNGYLFSLLYSTPIEMKGLTATPGIAQSWTLAPDNLSLTLHLRPGLKFSDGTPLDAAAIVWNVNWDKEPANASHALDYWKQVTATAVDPATVKLAFAKPMPEILAMLAGAPIVKPNAPTSGVSSGPYMVSNFAPGTSLTAVPNPHYWKTGAPHLAKIVISQYANPATGVLALQSGTLDMFTGAPANQTSALKSAGFRFLRAPSTHDGFLASPFMSILVNTSAPPLNDRRVRQALSLAFDRQEFVATALSGQGTPAASVFALSSPAYVPSPSTASFNLKAAKALLRQAGVKHLNLSIDSVSILPQNSFMPVYQQDLAKIGVTLSIHQIDSATWVTIVDPGNFPNLITQSNGFPDTDPAINFGVPDLLPVGNSEHFTSKQYTNLIDKAQVETDHSTRLADYKAAGKLLQQQMPIIPLADVSSLLAVYSPKVKGVVAGYGGFPDYSVLRLG